MPNTPKLHEDVREKLIKMIENNLWGLVCSCGGGGTNEENETCNLCDGTGITDWKHEPLIGEFEKLLAQELSTLKAQVRKEIEELKEPEPVEFELGKLRNETITDCLSIKSLEE